MKTIRTVQACILICLLAAGLAPSKSSLIEGVDTPHKYQHFTGYKGWLEVWISEGSLAASCAEIKIYEGIHYLGKVDKKYVFAKSYSNSCGDGKALQISLPPGTYTITASGTCGGLTTTKTIKALLCTTMELQ